MSSHKLIATEPEFFKLLLANTINRFGDSIDVVAYMWLVYELTSSASWTAFIYAANKLPNVILQPILGSWIEKREKKKIMVSVDVVRGCLVLILIALYFSNLMSIQIILGLTFVTSVVECFRIPAGMSFFQRVLNKENYKDGMAINSASNTFAELLGYFAAGIIISKVGCIYAIAIDGVTFFASALLICLIKVLQEELVMEKSKGLLVEFREGIQFIKKYSAIRNFILMAMFVNAILTPINTFILPFVREYLGGDSNVVSSLNISIAVGVFWGAIVTPRIMDKIGVDNSIVYAGMFLAASFIILTFTPSIPSHIVAISITIIVTSIYGIGIGIINTVLKTQLVSVVSNDYISRVSAVFNGCISAILPISAWLFGFVVNYISINIIFLLCGVVCMMIFGIVKRYNMNFSQEAYS